MKRLVILIISAFCLISCGEKHSVNFDECIIEFLSEEDPNFPSFFYSYNFFYQGENNKVILTNSNEFKFMYDDNNHNMDYKTFLKEVLNQQIVINKIHGNPFSLDKEVTREYKTKKFVDFLLLYFKNDKENHYFFKNKIDENKRNTIFYYLFINNYLTVFDDVIGVYSAFPSSIITKDLCKKE